MRRIEPNQSPGLLAGGQRIVGGPAVAQRDVEEPVRPEGDRAAVVVLERILVRDPDRAARWPGSATAAIGASRPEPRDDRTPGSVIVGRIVDEELLVLLEPGMECQPQQALLVAPVDRVGELEEQVPGPDGAVVGERPDLGLMLFDDEEPVAAVVGIGHRDRPVESQVREGDLGRHPGQGRVLVGGR